MIRQVLVIAGKEIIDHARETRSVFAAFVHVLMGPVIVLLVSFSTAGRSNAKGAGVVAGMMSIFALTAVFIGGMNVAMDVMAGERERRSLLPLLLNPVSRLRVVTGKWLATSVFSIGGLAVTLLAFVVVQTLTFGSSPLFSGPAMVCWALLGLVPLAWLAAALQLVVSTVSRTSKETQTYLSFLLFVPMGVAMFLVFFPRSAGAWFAFVPIAGQQMIAEAVINTGRWPVVQACSLALLTTTLTIAVILLCGRLLERDDVLYGS